MGLPHISRPVWIGIGVAATAIAGVSTWAIVRHQRAEERKNDPLAVERLGVDLVRQFDRQSRHGNFSGAVDVATEGVRLTHEKSDSYHTSGSRPTSDMTGLPTGSKQGGSVHYSVDMEYDGTRFWHAVDAHTGGDGAVTSDELRRFLDDRYDTGGTQGTLDRDEMARLRADHPSVFEGEREHRY